MRRPDFFIVGAPKTGTTALYRYLAAHPDVFVPSQKEQNFFGSDLTFRYGHISETEYLTHFAGAEGQRRVGEASVWYLYSRRAAVEIHEFAPDARIIAMLRDPVDLLHSLHSELVFNGYEVLEDFEGALAAEPRRRQGVDIPTTAHPVEALFYREVVRFAEQLERWFDVFGRERVHVILYDDLAADPAGVYADVLAFLDLDPGFGPAEFRVVNPNKTVHSRRLQRALVRPALPFRALGVLSRPLADRLIDGLKELNRRHQARAPLDPELEQRLRLELAPGIDRLADLLGRDLDAWLPTGSR